MRWIGLDLDWIISASIGMHRIGLASIVCVALGVLYELDCFGLRGNIYLALRRFCSIGMDSFALWF